VTEEGGAGIVLLAVVGFALVLSMLIADIGGYLAARLQAAAAADAAALASAPVTFSGFGDRGTPISVAVQVAAANGGRLVECRCPVDRSWGSRRVDVVVAREVSLMLFGSRQVRASSAAEFDPRALVDE
jgi:secretion/DNA translocation related TadE-like protein